MIVFLFTAFWRDFIFSIFFFFSSNFITILFKFIQSFLSFFIYLSLLLFLIFYHLFLFLDFVFVPWIFMNILFISTNIVLLLTYNRCQSDKVRLNFGSTQKKNKYFLLHSRTSSMTS